MHPKLAPIFKDKTELYPRKLEADFARVFDNIMAKWETPELENYLRNLILIDQPGRAGFPSEVLREIILLQDIDEKLRKNKQEQEDVWTKEATRKGLEAEKIEYNPLGFFRAVETGNERATQLFLDAGVNIDLPNEVGWTPLMLSIFMRSEKTAIQLIDAGAKPDMQDNRGYGPLHFAAYQGFVLVVERLLQRGVPANLKSRAGVTALMQAAVMGHSEVMMLLLDKGAGVNAADYEGWTALHKAVANGHVEAVELLLKAGADPNAQHVGGATPASIATQKGKPEIVSLVCK